MKIYTNNTNPNFTIVLPGPCQANCDFCFWKREENESSFLKSLKRVLKKLPNSFTQISISGGEPSLSPVFEESLNLIKKYKNKGKFNKVVLTSNGINLMEYDLSGIDHINISRHHFNEGINREVFKTKNVPDSYELEKINKYINKFGIDVNYNVVLTKENETLEIGGFIDFAKQTGASSLTFRNQYGNYGLSKVEDIVVNLWKHKPFTISTCPVCITNTYIIKGMKVKFHSSDYEPTESEKFNENEVYELILHPSGNLTRDWEAKKIILKRKG